MEGVGEEGEGGELAGPRRLYKGGREENRRRKRRRWRRKMRRLRQEGGECGGGGEIQGGDADGEGV